MNRAIENAIGPYYSYVRPRYLSKLGNGNLEVRPENAPELPKEVFRMLLCIGPYLHRNALLLQKVYKVFSCCTLLCSLWLLCSVHLLDEYRFC